MTVTVVDVVDPATGRVTEMGVTAVRTAHCQHSPLSYELADRRGFLVWTEIPLIDLTTATPEFRASVERQTSELVRRNRRLTITLEGSGCPNEFSRSRWRPHWRSPAADRDRVTAAARGR